MLNITFDLIFHQKSSFYLIHHMFHVSFMFIRVCYNQHIWRICLKYFHSTFIAQTYNLCTKQTNIHRYEVENCVLLVSLQLILNQIIWKKWSKLIFVHHLFFHSIFTPEIHKKSDIKNFTNFSEFEVICFMSVLVEMFRKDMVNIITSILLYCVYGMYVVEFYYFIFMM